MTTSTQITKSVSDEGDGSKKGSDTMGMKHRVDHGVYIFTEVLILNLQPKRVLVAPMRKN